MTPQDPNITDAIMGAFIVFFILAYIPRIFFVLSLNKTLRAIPKSCQRFPRWFVWMILIPVVVDFVFAWIMLPFGAPSAMKAASSENPLAIKKAKAIFGVGLAMMICLSSIFLKFPLVIFAAFVLWIIYWVQIVKFRKYINASAIENPMPKIVDKSQMPAAIKLSCYLLIALFLSFLVSIFYAAIAFAPVYQEFLKAAHPEIDFNAHYLLAASGTLEGIVLFIFTIIMVKGLRNGKHGVYIFTLVSTIIGLCLSVFGIFSPFFMESSFKSMIGRLQPESVTHLLSAIRSAQMYTMPVLFVQFGLLIILLFALLSKKAKAWCQ